MTHPDDEMGCWHPEPPPYDLDETRRIGRAFLFGIPLAAIAWAALAGVVLSLISCLAEMQG